MIHWSCQFDTKYLSFWTQYYLYSPQIRSDWRYLRVTNVPGLGYNLAQVSKLIFRLKQGAFLRQCLRMAGQRPCETSDHCQLGGYGLGGWGYQLGERPVRWPGRSLGAGKSQPSRKLSPIPLTFRASLPSSAAKIPQQTIVKFSNVSCTNPKWTRILVRHKVFIKEVIRKELVCQKCYQTLRKIGKFEQKNSL